MNRIILNLQEELNKDNKLKASVKKVNKDKTTKNNNVKKVNKDKAKTTKVKGKRS